MILSCLFNSGFNMHHHLLMHCIPFLHLCLLLEEVPSVQLWPSYPCMHWHSHCPGPMLAHVAGKWHIAGCCSHSETPVE